MNEGRTLLSQSLYSTVRDRFMAGTDQIILDFWKTQIDTRVLV